MTAETATGTDADAGDARGEATGHGGHDGHGSRWKIYTIAMVVLAVVTIVEVQVPAFPYSQTVIIALLFLLAAVKAAFVVAFYMHLKYETRALQLLPLVPLALVAILLLALFFGIEPV